MTNVVLNADGTTYMTFTSSMPSPGDLEGWYVRTISTGYGHTSTSDCVSFNELLKMIENASGDYGYRARSSKVADRT